MSLRFSWPRFALLLALIDCASAPPAPRLEAARADPPLVSPALPVLREEKEPPARRAAEDAAKTVEPSAPELPRVEKLTRAGLPRITSVSVFTYIYARPTRNSYQYGYVRVGSSLGLRSPDPIRREGCATAWYAVEPRGFVCNDDTTILETEQRKLPPSVERLLKGYLSMTPSEGPLPYGYALSLGTPMYGRIPDSDERELHESRYGPAPIALGRWAKGHDALASVDPPPADEDVPWFLANGGFAPVTVRGRDTRLVRKQAPRGSLISYASAFESDGRTWLLTPELAVVPADRVRPYRTSSFHGIVLAGSWTLPIAWMRRHPRPKWRAGEGGRLAPTEEAWAARTAVGLTGKRVTQERHVLLETVEPGTYVDESDATLVEKATERPAHVGEGEKWIQISVEKGTLTAYEGDRPVFTTLVSPGSGGLQRTKYPPLPALVARHITPLGSYRIQFKDRFSAMSPDPEQKKFFISDVPFIQYFYGPFALHAAYWHEDFGEPHSGGCVNLSPEDAARIFGWTDPPLPSGWQAVRSIGAIGPGTLVQIVP